MESAEASAIVDWIIFVTPEPGGRPCREGKSWPEPRNVCPGTSEYAEVEPRLRNQVSVTWGFPT